MHHGSRRSIKVYIIGAVKHGEKTEKVLDMLDFSSGRRPRRHIAVLYVPLSLFLTFIFRPDTRKFISYDKIVSESG